MQNQLQASNTFNKFELSSVLETDMYYFQYRFYILEVSPGDRCQRFMKF